MSGLPTVQVLLDDGTGTFPHDVTTRARLVDGFSFNRGREDEQAAVTAGALTLAFNNADGRFTPGSTLIDSPSPITVDQRIRLKETVNGVTHTRFTGYVKSWRVGWPAGVDTHSVVQVTATDAQARAERRVLRSVIEEEIRADAPAAHYMLGEPEGSASAADTSGNQAPALTSGDGVGVVFGTATGPGTDGLTAVQFTGSGSLRTDSLSSTAVLGMVCAFSSTTAVISSIMRTTSADGTSFGRLQLNNTAGRLVFLGASGTITSAATVTDGETHVAEVYYDAGSYYLYLDGALAGSVASPAPTSATGLVLGGTDIGADTLVVSHAAIFTTAPSVARIGDHYAAMATGFAGESGTDRITRLAGYAGIPLGTLDTSLTNVPHKDITGASAWSAIAEATEAEGGLSLIDGSGNLIFLNRNDAVTKLAADLSVSAEFIHFDAAPTDDDAEILNYVETTAEATGVPQVAADTASETTHGRYSDSKTYLVTTDAEALDRANWIIGNYAEPTTRFGTLTVNLFGMTAAQQESAIDALEPGAWLRVTDMPSQTTGGTTVDVMVQGFTEEQSATSWSLTCNVVARSLFEAAIYDDATFGVYGESRYYY